MQNDIVRQPPQPKDESSNIPVRSAPEVPSQDTIEPPQNQNTLEDVHSQTEQEQPAPHAEDPAENTEPEVPADQPPIVKHKSTKPIGVIMAAVVVCAGLTGGAIYAGLQQSDKGSNIAKTNTGQQAQTKTDDTLPELDAALEDTANIQTLPGDLSTDLSDSSLGL